MARGAGTTEAFTCPYHGWTYDLCGMLTGAAFMREAEQFDPRACRLPPLRLGIWAGWIFVTFDQDAEPFDLFIADYAEDLGLFRLEAHRLFARQYLDFDCNWKFAVENLLDFYHLEVLHAASIGARIDVGGFDFRIKARGGCSAEYEASPDTPDGTSLFGKMPWLEDKSENFQCAAFLAPNMMTFGCIDEVHSLVTWPLSPSTCRVVVYHLFPEALFERPDFEDTARVYHDFIGAVLDEDRDLLRSIQHNMGSRYYRPGCMSDRENNIHHFITYHLGRVFGEA